MKVIKSQQIIHNHTAELVWFPDTDTYDFVLFTEGERIRILDQGYVNKEEIEMIWPKFKKNVNLGSRMKSRGRCENE